MSELSQTLGPTGISESVVDRGAIAPSQSHTLPHRILGGEDAICHSRRNGMAHVICGLFLTSHKTRPRLPPEAAWLHHTTYQIQVRSILIHAAANYRFMVSHLGPSNGSPSKAAKPTAVGFFLAEACLLSIEFFGIRTTVAACDFIYGIGLKGNRGQSTLRFSRCKRSFPILNFILIPIIAVQMGLAIARAEVAHELPRARSTYHMNVSTSGFVF